MHLFYVCGPTWGPKAGRRYIELVTRFVNENRVCRGCGGEGVFHKHPCPLLAEGLRLAASAIEARSDATVKQGAAEGESAVPQGDAHE